MAAAARYSRANPTWNDVSDTINRLDSLSRRLHILKQNLNKFDVEVDNLSAMLNTLTAQLDAARKSILRQNVNDFIRSADIFLEFAQSDTTARTPRQNEQLATSW